MDVVSTLSIKLSVDSDEYLIHEGDLIRNLTYTRRGNSSTVSGVVRLIDVTSKASDKIEQTCPPASFATQLLSVNALYLDISSKYNATIEKINISEITSIGAIEVPKEPDAEIDLSDPDIGDVNTILTNLEDGATVKFSEGDVKQNLNISKSVTLEGNTSGVSQNFPQEV